MLTTSGRCTQFVASQCALFSTHVFSFKFKQLRITCERVEGETGSQCLQSNSMKTFFAVFAIMAKKSIAKMAEITRKLMVKMAKIKKK